MATEEGEPHLVIFHLEDTGLCVSGFLSWVSSFSPYAQWLCPSQLEGVLVEDLAADSGPIDRCCCCRVIFWFTVYELFESRAQDVRCANFF